MKAHATGPKNAHLNAQRVSLVRLALKRARAKMTKAAAAAATAANQKDEASKIAEKRPKETMAAEDKGTRSASRKLVKESRKLASIAADPFRLKMKVKLEPLQIDFEKTMMKKKKKKKKSLINECPKCPKTFPTTSGLNRHVKQVHQKTQNKNKKRRRRSSKAATEDEDARPAKRSQKQSLEDSLTCPICDRSFMAKSIFERHLKTSGHGQRQQQQQVSMPLPYATGRNAPHLNVVLQPTMEVGGRKVNKYECHLCQAVFVRVKDLAKHRERQCSAYSNIGKA
jgi:uncharacterized C2H2 Zn-finger protein